MTRSLAAIEDEVASLAAHVRSLLPRLAETRRAIAEIVTACETVLEAHTCAGCAAGVAHAARSPTGDVES